jgi:anti-anti-sigma factor
MQNAHDPTVRTVEVELLPVAAPAFAATVRLSGEHDLATRREIQDAIDPIEGDVLVDLSACEFIDSSVIVMLLAAHYARRREGQRLELLLPVENSKVTRTLEVSGARQLLTVHVARP